MKTWHRFLAWMYNRHLIEERRKLAQYVREYRREISQWQDDIEDLEIRVRGHVRLAGLDARELAAPTLSNVIPLRKHAA